MVLKIKDLVFSNIQLFNIAFFSFTHLVWMLWHGRAPRSESNFVPTFLAASLKEAERRICFSTVCGPYRTRKKPEVLTIQEESQASQDFGANKFGVGTPRYSWRHFRWGKIWLRFLKLDSGQTWRDKNVTRLLWVVWNPVGTQVMFTWTDESQLTPNRL